MTPYFFSNPATALIKSSLNCLTVDSLNFYQLIWTSGEGVELTICGEQFWEIDTLDHSILDPNGDDYNEYSNLEGTEGNVLNGNLSGS